MDGCYKCSFSSAPLLPARGKSGSRNPSGSGHWPERKDLPEHCAAQCQPWDGPCMLCLLGGCRIELPHVFGCRAVPFSALDNHGDRKDLCLSSVRAPSPTGSCCNALWVRSHQVPRLSHEVRKGPLRPSSLINTAHQPCPSVPHHCSPTPLGTVTSPPQAACASA